MTRLRYQIRSHYRGVDQAQAPVTWEEIVERLEAETTVGLSPTPLRPTSLIMIGTAALIVVLVGVLGVVTSPADPSDPSPVGADTIPVASSTTPPTTSPATTTTAQTTTSTSSAPEASQVIVTIDEATFRIEPDDVVVGPPGGFQLLVVNDTSEDQQIVFVSIFAGSPDDLPVVDGLVDVSRCNQIFGDPDEENPSPASFGCFGYLGEATPIEVVQLNPGETRPVDDGVPAGVHLIIDHMPGGYEEGRYAVFEVLEPPE